MLIVMRSRTHTDFDDATAVFHKLHESDPYRLEDLDVLSNILYVSEKRAELATLAQEYTRIDRMRPETCCLVGKSLSTAACIDELRRRLTLAASCLLPLFFRASRSRADVERDSLLAQATISPSVATTRKPSPTSAARSNSIAATSRRGR